MSQRPSPHAGSAYVSTNYGIVQNPYPNVIYTPDAIRKTEAEHQATAERLIAEMLAGIDQYVAAARARVEAMTAS